MDTKSANFIFTPLDTGNNHIIVPADDFTAAVDICRAIGATRILVNDKPVSSACRNGCKHADQMIVFFRPAL